MNQETRCDSTGLRVQTAAIRGSACVARCVSADRDSHASSDRESLQPRSKRRSKLPFLNSWWRARRPVYPRLLWRMENSCGRQGSAWPIWRTSFLRHQKLCTAWARSRNRSRPLPPCSFGSAANWIWIRPCRGTARHSRRSSGPSPRWNCWGTSAESGTTIPSRRTTPKSATRTISKMESKPV